MKIFRIWALGLFLLVSALLFLLFSFFLNDFVKNGLIFGLSKVSGRDVYIKDVDFSIFKGFIDIKSLKVADKNNTKKNILDIEEIKLDVNMQKLITWKKLEIEKGSIKNIRFNTVKSWDINDDSKSKTSTLSKEKEEKLEVSPKNRQSLEKIKDLLNPPDVKEILEKENLKTKEVADNYIDKTRQIKDKWSNLITESENSLKDLQRQIKDLEKKAKNVKSISDLKKLKEDLKILKNSIKHKKEQIDNLKRQFNEDLKIFKAFKTDIETAFKEDYENLQEKYSFDLEGGLNIVGTLFGEKYKEYIKKGLKIYELISPFLSGKEEKREKEEKTTDYRLVGDWVVFEDLTNKPDIVIKNIALSILFNNIKLEGTATDYSDNPKLYGKPFKLGLFAKQGKDFKEFSINSIFDRTKNDYKDTINIGVKEGTISKVDLPNVITIKNARYNMYGKVNIINTSKIAGNIKFNFSNVIPEIHMKGEIGKIIKESILAAKEFYLLLDLSGNINSPKFTFKTDIDEKINKNLKLAVKRRIEILKKDIKNEIQKEKNKYLKMLSLNEDEIKKYMNMLNKYQDILNKDNKSLDSILDLAKKEIKNILKKNIKEKKIKGLEKDLEKKLKKLKKENINDVLKLKF